MTAASILLLWLLIVCVVQMSTGWGLLVAAGVSIFSSLIFAPIHCLRLFKRMCLLLLTLVVLFAWFTPGEALLMNWPTLSPSREGVALALSHGGRLLAVVCWVAVLLGKMPLDRLLSGLYTLLHPLKLIGLSAEKVALRLTLTLRYVDATRAGATAGSKWNWRQWLMAADSPDADAGEPVHIVHEPWRATDFGVLAVALSGVVFLGWLQ